MGSVSIKTVLSLAVAFGLAAFALTASAAPTAKAVYDANTKTLTLYYDDVDHSGEGVVTQVNNGKPSGWPADGAKTTVTKVIIDESFHNWQPTNTEQWFYGYTKVTSFEGLSNIDVSKSTSLRRFFRGTAVTELDLSEWDTSKVSGFHEMFQGCGFLTTIYASANFVVDQGTNFTDMFTGCKNLVGGNNTKFDAANDYKTYARIDLPGQPGYFTGKDVPLPPTIESVDFTDLTHESVTIITKGKNINGGSVTIELWAGEKVAEKSLDDFGSAAFAELTPETTYTVKVTAKNEYGSVTDETCSFATPAKPADEWKVVLDAEEGTGTVSWSEWKFEAKLAKDKTLIVGKVLEWPDAVLALDFSLPVKDGGGTTYVISDLSPAFGHHDESTGWKPAGYEPQCLRVGLLTLPGDGLVTIGQAAFAGCANAIGTLSFPTTLTSFGTSAFANCVSLQIDGSTIPAGVTQISQYCFAGDKEMFGDVVLPNVTIVRDSGFQETAITSATFGPSLAWIGGNYERGAFQKCAALTNLVFDATSRARIYNTFTFQDCTALEELDLRGVVDFSTDNDRNDRSHIKGCTKLKKITFGAGLTNLMYNAMAGATALEEVVFEGVPPVGFQTPYLSAKNSKGEHETGYDNQKVTTYVHRKLCGVKNEAGKCWNDYAANGQIGAAKKNPAKNTTWAAKYVYEGVDLAKRPLLTIEPGTGLTLLVR